MRKIISQGPNTVMEGVFTSPFVPPSLRRHGPRSDNDNRSKARQSKRLRHQRKCAVVLAALLASTPVFAASPGATTDQKTASGQRVESVQPTGRYESLRQPYYGSKKSANSRQADAGRVYLDDYQKVPEAVTRKRSTEAVWLGQKDKSK
jgi:hypothetical protein